MPAESNGRHQRLGLAQATTGPPASAGSGGPAWVSAGIDRGPVPRSLVSRRRGLPRSLGATITRLAYAAQMLDRRRCVNRRQGIVFSLVAWPRMDATSSFSSDCGMPIRALLVSAAGGPSPSSLPLGRAQARYQGLRQRNPGGASRSGAGTSLVLAGLVSGASQAGARGQDTAPELSARADSS